MSLSFRERVVIGILLDTTVTTPKDMAISAAQDLAEACCGVWGHDWAPVRYDGAWRGPGTAGFDDNGKCRRCGASWTNPEAERIAGMRNQQPFR